MYSIVVLKTEPKHLTIVPMSWFISLDIVQIFNYGISHTKRHRIFFSPNMDDEPVFNLELSPVFDENTTANYLVHVHSVWATYDDAERHMGTRRHILPAIYNANRERFHWAPEPEIAAEPEAVEVKPEPIDGLIWMNGQTIDLLDDSEDELELENGAEAIKMEAHVDFPNAPNEVIDLTDNDFTKYVIAFSASEDEPNLDDELDGQLEWFGQFPGPISMKGEPQEEMVVRNEPQQEMVIENELLEEMVVQNEPVIDKLLGNLIFELDNEGARLINIDGTVIRISETMYTVLLHYNVNPLYTKTVFDAKFITLNVVSLFRPQEIRERVQITMNDVRLKFIRHLFEHRAQNNVVRMAWFENHISQINDWIMNLGRQ